MEEEYDLEKEVDRIKSSVDLQMQVAMFREVLNTIRQYTANTLPSKLDEDIRHTLNKVMSLSKLRNTEITLLTIQYMECLSKLRTVYIHDIVPYLYDLTDTNDSVIKESAYTTFSNVYIYVLLAAAKVMRSADHDVREMWEKAEKMRKSLIRYYSRGGPLSLISLRFIHRLCHFYTKRDDRILYNGKTGVVETSIQFTINDIPEGSPLFRAKDLVLDGYDYVNMIIQAFMTKASVFTFKHKVIAINSLFSIITHRKDFIPIILPILIKYKPTNETIQYIITSNMQRILKIPTFGDYEVTLMDYLTTAGVHEDAINRARDQRNRIGDFLKRKRIDLTPGSLSPSFGYDYKEEKDSLFEKELESVMKNLGSDAMEPLSTPAMDLKSMPLSVIKMFPISILATLALANLQNKPQTVVEAEDQGSVSVKREGEVDDMDRKRRKQNEATVRQSEFLDVPTRELLLKELTTQLIHATQNKAVVSQSHCILFDTVFSLLTISDEERILDIIENILGSDISSQAAETVTESYPFADVLSLIRDSIPTDSSFLILFLKRLYIRKKLYQIKCKTLGISTPSSFYEQIYNSVVLYTLQRTYQLIDSSPSSLADSQTFLTTVLQAIPVVPFELFPYVLSASVHFKNQETLNWLSLQLLRDLAFARPIYLYECFSCMLSFASSLVMNPLPSSTYPSDLNGLLITILSNQDLFYQFISFVTNPSESAIYPVVQKLASFSNGILVLPAPNAEKAKKVQKSGLFSMATSDQMEEQKQRQQQEAILHNLTEMNSMFALLAAVKCDTTQIQLFIQYVTDHSSGVDSSSYQQIINQFCLPVLPSIHSCVEPIPSEEIEDNQYTIYSWKDSDDYNSLYNFVQILVECIAINKQLVLTILRYCLRVSKIIKDEDLLALVDNMYTVTQDVQLKYLVMNWLEKEEVMEVLSQDPIPSCLVDWLLFIAEDPHPLTLVELVVILCKHSIDKTMLNCLQICVRSELFPIDIFLEALGYLLVENIDAQKLIYIVLSIITGKANVEEQVCGCLIDYAQRGGFKSIDNPDSLIAFISHCKEASAALLYVMSQEELEVILKKLPSAKSWLLSYFEKEGKTIPDYMTSLLLCVCDKHNSITMLWV